jgi:hypothetical protein
MEDQWQVHNIYSTSRKIKYNGIIFSDWVFL